MVSTPVERKVRVRVLTLVEKRNLVEREGERLPTATLCFFQFPRVTIVGRRDKEDSSSARSEGGSELCPSLQAIQSNLF